MKTIFLIFLSFGSLSHAQITTADRTSYIITLQTSLNLSQLDKCVESICYFSGNRINTECEIVSERFRIVAANLSNSAVNKVKALSCVKSLRHERMDFKARPRSGRSN